MNRWKIAGISVVAVWMVSTGVSLPLIAMEANHQSCLDEAQLFEQKINTNLLLAASEKFPAPNDLRGYARNIDKELSNARQSC